MKSPHVVPCPKNPGTSKNTMMWVLSTFLCVALVVAMFGVMFPDIVLPILKKLWDKQFYYWK
jgi:hypothetical protein